MITFLRFARAHTVVGTSLSLLALYLMAARSVGEHDWLLLGWSLLSCLAANVYITGLNQLTDIDIDRINKPYLPLASGAYSVQTGRLIVLVSLALALVTALLYWPWLTLTVYLSLALGTAYSLPPIRLKRFHFWAAFCIIAVRGLIVNILLYLHFRTALGGGAQVQTTLVLLTIIIFIFGLVIAWFKDLPDTEGDAAHGIRTLSLIKNRTWVFRWGTRLLFATLVGVTGYCFWLGKTGLGLAHLPMIALFLFYARGADLENQSSIARFYQGTWRVFFGVYIIYALLG
ncbi:homogentisate phytyltransferase [Lewinella sp. W8]|uniref:homogentisate phytyltransferase n=1 Tax=Lewinella sp. W8 TaxID=2528208 RepID=UPI001067C4FF|nr:homogentisate phytyltransferase [Lewinella sp. W8]MTB51036.1 homogentisate phytyltransferase [Lewinella sp. W8]